MEDKIEELDYRKLPIGSKVKVYTQNSVYTITKDSIHNDLIEGGFFDRQYKTPLDVYMNGCTFGGSMIKPGIIEVGMYLEIGLGEGQRITTSAIQKIKVLKKPV